jgi:hypothetical protein
MKLYTYFLFTKKMVTFRLGFVIHDSINNTVYNLMTYIKLSCIFYPFFLITL